MGINKKSYILLWFFFAAFYLQAQVPQADYIEAKRLYQTGDYRAAKGAFEMLSTDSELGAFASFYYALSAYQLGELFEANLMWRQVLVYYPNWKQLREVLYWLVKVNFELKKFDEALQYLSAYTQQTTSNDVEKEFVTLYLGEQPLDIIQPLYTKYPAIKSLAVLLAIRLREQPYATRDQELLDELIRANSLSSLALLGDEVVNEMKEAYDVAVLLPFLFESLDNPLPVVRNTLVMDLYQGMLLAQKHLGDQGVKINLYPYDTRKSGAETMKIFDDITGADLIIGPLYSGPVQEVLRFSRDQKINVINPLSGNSGYLDENPFSYLARPTYETMAIKMAEYVAEQHYKRTAFVYFGKSERDSLFAYSYKATLENNNVKVLDFKSLTDASAKELMDKLVNQSEKPYPKAVADSIAKIQGRFIKTRRHREGESEKIPFYYEQTNNGQPVDVRRAIKWVDYEMVFDVKKDTVGHIMVASQSNGVVNNLISAVAARGDSTGLYGYGNWFDLKVINYSLLDQLDVKLAMPEYVNKSGSAFSAFEREIRNTYHSYPSEYHVAGYELLMYAGRMMKRYGKYFQSGLSKEGVWPGVLQLGVDYRGGNDNQVVPIVEIKNHVILPVTNETNADQ
ncbi:MAG: ABC transporter substrate-binding protein [Cyclobacteriaceae bacterium]|nr:ABC transporter substrate-binding protein [Cyclobacteriaceae bacterium]